MAITSKSIAHREDYLQNYLVVLALDLCWYGNQMCFSLFSDVIGFLISPLKYQRSLRNYILLLNINNYSNMLILHQTSHKKYLKLEVWFMINHLNYPTNEIVFNKLLIVITHMNDII